MVHYQRTRPVSSSIHAILGLALKYGHSDNRETTQTSHTLDMHMKCYRKSVEIRMKLCWSVSAEIQRCLFE